MEPNPYMELEQSIASGEQQPAPQAVVPASTAPPANPYMQLEAQVGEEEKQRKVESAQLLQWKAANAKADPARQADVLRYSAASGLAPDFVDKSLDQVRKEVDAKGTDWGQVVQRHPELANYMLENPHKAPLVQDDIANAGLLHWTIEAPFHVMWDEMKRQRAVALQFGEFAGTGSEQKRAEIRQLEADSSRDYGERSGLAKSYVGAFRMVPMILGDLAARAVGGWVGVAVGGGTGAAAGAAAGAPAAGVGAVPGAAVGVTTGAVGGGFIGQQLGSAAFNAYESIGPLYWQLSEMKDSTGKPLDPAVARAFAGAGGLVNGALMSVGLGKIAGNIPILKGALLKLGEQTVAKALAQESTARIATNFAKRYGENVLTGATVMAAQGAVNAGAARLAAGVSGQPFNQDELPGVGESAANSFASGLQDMALLSLWGPGRELLGDIGRARRSTENEHRLEAMTESARASKLLERSPEAFQELVARFKEKEGAVTDVHIRAEDFQTYWQGQKLDPGEVAAAVMGDGGKGYAEAVATKGDIVIPVEKYLAKLAKTDHAAGMQDLVRLSQDDLSPKDKRALQEKWDAKEKAFKALPPDKMDEGQRAVYDDYYARSTGAGQEHEVADANAKLVAGTFKGWGEALSEKSTQAGGGLVTAWEAYTRLADVNIRGSKGEMFKDTVAPAAGDGSFNFGENLATDNGKVRKLELDKAKEAIARMSAGHRNRAQAFLDYTQGLRKGRPNITAEMEQHLARFGVVDPQGYAFDENGRRLDGITYEQPPALKGVRPRELNLDAPIKVTKTDGTELGEFPASLSDNEARAIIQPQVKHLQGQSFRNDSTEWTISIGANGLSHALQFPSLENALGVLSLPELIKHAVLTESEKARAKRRVDPNTIAMHVLQAPMEVAGQMYRVKLTVKESTDGDRLYHLESLEMETPGAIMEGVGSVATPDTGSGSPGEITVRQFLAGAKRRDGTPYIPEPSTGSESTASPGEQPPGPESATGPLKVKLEGGKGERGFITFEPANGSGEPRRFDIQLLKNADRSTLAHETFHFLSEVMGDLASASDAPERVKADYATLLNFMGHESHDARVAGGKELAGLSRKTDLTPEEKTRQRALTAKEERVTHAWEQYLAEGKTPSAELAGVFARFRNWMVRIYGALSSEGIQKQFREKFSEDIGLTPEVRQVFDRLVARDEELARAHAAEEAQPFQPALEKMTPEERAQYEELTRESRASAEEELQHRITSATRKENSKWMTSERERFRGEVEAELDTQPLQQALWFLQKGEVRGGETPAELKGPDGQALKLDRKELLERYGAEFVQTLPKGSTVSKGGVPADYLAEFLGFTTGDEMVRAIQRAEPRDRTVEGEVQRRMEELYGPSLLQDPQRLGEEALASTHNEASLKRALLELRALRRQLDPATDPRARGVDAETIRATAERIIADKKVGDYSPGSYLTAERAAARRALEFAAEGKLDKAFDEKEAQLLNMMLYREARDARDESLKAVDELKRYTTDKVRAELGKAGGPYLEQMDRLLDGFELRQSVSRTEVDRRVETLKWLEAERAEGRDPILPDRLLEKLARTTHWKELTLDELRELRDTARNVEHLADLKNTLLTTKGRRDRNEAIGELTSAALENVPEHKVYTSASKDLASVGDKALRTGRKARAVVERLEQIILRLDGGKEDGPWHRYLWDTLSQADYRFRDLRRETSNAITDHIRNLPSEMREKLRTETFTVAGQPMTMEHAVVVALNMGNESNQKKLLDGYNDRVSKAGLEPWTPATLEEIAGRLRREHWDLVQNIGRSLEKLWPEMAALEKRLTGLEPEKLKTRPFTRTLADGSKVELEGWYYPVIYDTQFAGAGQRRGEASAASVQLFDPGYYRAITPQGHLQARNEEYSRPINLSLDALPGHVEQATKDIAMRESLLSAIDLLKSERVHAALLRTVGEEGIKTIQGAIRDTANDLVIPDGGSGFINGLVSKTRSGMAGAVFGVNVAQTVQNLTGFANVAQYVPGNFMRQAIWKVAHSRADAIVDVVAKSAEMRNRAGHLDRDLGEELRKLRGESGPIARTKEAALWAFSVTDKAVAYPTWMAAYEHARAPGEKKGLGLEEAEAIKHADGVVRKGLAAARTLDLPSFMRDPRWKIVTMFAGWSNSQLNQLMEAGNDAGRLWSDGQRYAALRRLTKSMMWLSIGAVMSKAATGSLWKDKDDDGNDAGDAARWAVTEAAFAPLSWIPVAGPILKAAQSGRDPSFTPWTRPFEEALKAGSAAWKLGADYIENDQVDPEQLSRATASTLSTAGYFMGLPVSQATTTGSYLKSISTGEDSPKNPADFALGVAFGKKKKGKAAHVLFGGPE